MAGLICVLSAYGLMQLYGLLPSNNPDFKVTGPFYNPARYAGYLAALLPFCLSGYFFYPQKGVWRALVVNMWAVACLSAILVLPGTLERSAWLGIIAFAAVLIFYRYRPLSKRYSQRKCTIPVLVLAALILIYSFYSIKPQSALGRLTIWKIRGRIVRVHPWFGIGYGNFEYQYDTYQAGYYANNPPDLSKVQNADVISMPYNIFLQVLCEEGIAGLLFFITFLAAILFQFSRSATTENDSNLSLKLASIGVVISTLVAGLTSYLFDILPVMVISFVALGTLSGLESRIANKSPHAPTISKGLGISRISLIIFSITFSATMLVNASTRLKAYKQWKGLAVTHASSGALAALLPVSKGDLEFIEYYLNMLMEEKAYVKAIDLYKQTGYLWNYPTMYADLAEAYATLGQNKAAEKYFKLASNMVPDKFYFKDKLMLFYYDSRQYESAADLAEQILKMKAKVPSAMVSNLMEHAKEMVKKTENTLPAGK